MLARLNTTTEKARSSFTGALALLSLQERLATSNRTSIYTAFVIQQKPQELSNAIGKRTAIKYDEDFTKNPLATHLNY